MSNRRERSAEFSLRLTEASRRVVSRAEMVQTVVDAAAECVGAISAAFFDRDGDGRLRRTVVAGLFPPLTSLEGATGEEFPTRTRLIGHVLQTEEVLPRESVAGGVAATGRGELIAEAAADPRIVAHTDPALTVRSIIFVPLALSNGALGVLALANSVSGRSFTSEDFALAESLAELAALALAEVA